MNSKEQPILWQAIGMWIAGKSTVWISQTINKPRTTISRWIKRYRETGTCQRLTGSGRPPVTNRRLHRRIIRCIQTDRFLTSSTLKQECDFPGSERTLRRVLNNYGLNARRPVRVPWMTTFHRKARLEWAMLRCHWREKQWRNIVWSDEARFQLRTVDGRIRVWRSKGQRYTSGMSVSTLQGGGGSVTVWGAVWSDGKSELVILDGTMTGLKYLKILNEHIKPLISRRPTFIFQDDNAPAHRCHDVQLYKLYHGARCIPWPTRSPDLNPIEHCWDHLKRRISGISRPQNLADLKIALEEYW